MRKCWLLLHGCWSTSAQLKQHHLTKKVHHKVIFLAFGGFLLGFVSPLAALLAQQSGPVLLFG